MACLLAVHGIILLEINSLLIGIMNVILNHYFPSSEGYIHRPEDCVVSGYVEINTHQWVPTPAGVTDTLLPPVTATPEIRVYFLVTQFKAARYEQDTATWAVGADRLNRYMRVVKGGSNP